MKLEIEVIENTWMGSYFPKGWGNGYVILPKKHPFHGIDYDIINLYVDVNGGLTYSDTDENGNWKIGFDTAHSWDTPEMWPEEAVIKETYRLRDQLIELGEIYSLEQVESIMSSYYDDREPEYDPEQ